MRRRMVHGTEVPCYFRCVPPGRQLAVLHFSRLKVGPTELNLSPVVYLEATSYPGVARVVRFALEYPPH